jgi:DNA-binding response OmpR family regulator
MIPWRHVERAYDRDRATATGAVVSARVLVVEDDADVAKLVRAYLERDGFAVSVESDGEAGLRRALADPPDLVVLDWMLPRLDGRGVLEGLRRSSAVPVIVLTARSDELDRVLGLELGADDYVTKPFSPRELVARVRAVLRRGSAPAAPTGEAPLAVGALMIDAESRRVTYAGESVPLTTLEFDLLQTLARAPQRVFSRDELIERVWGPSFSGVERVVDVHVANVRQKLAAAGADQLVRTVRGVGYALE